MVDLKRVFFLILTTLLLTGVAKSQGAGTAGYVEVRVFDPARDASKDILQAVTEAKRTGRRVLVDVGGDWCVWCRRLDSLFVSHEDLRKFRDQHYVNVKVNWSKENKNEKVLSRYPVIPGYPHLFVLDGNGGLLKSQDTGELEEGKGHDPVKVMTFLAAWAE